MSNPVYDHEANARSLEMKTRLKADLFDYLAWLEDHGCMRDVPKGTDYLVLASDGTTCWGKTYLEAARVALEHDKALQYGKKQPSSHLLRPAPEVKSARAAQGGAK